jgi:hypothetical protein
MGRTAPLPNGSQHGLTRNPISRSSVAFIWHSSRVPKRTTFDATPGEESLRQGDGLPSVTSTGYSWKVRLRGGGDTRRSEDPDSNRGHNSFDRGGLPAPFQAQALKWPSHRPYSIHPTPGKPHPRKIRIGPVLYSRLSYVEPRRSIAWHT